MNAPYDAGMEDPYPPERELPDPFINAAPSARIYPHLIIRVSRSLGPEKASFLFVRHTTAMDSQAPS